MAATATAPRVCLLSPKKTFTPTKGQALLLRRETEAQPLSPSPTAAGTHPSWESTPVPGLLLPLHPLPSAS